MPLRDRYGNPIAIKNFKAYEVVPKDLYEIYGEDAFFFVDTALLSDIDKLRDDLDSAIVINNWHIGGAMDSRGYRPYFDTDGAKFSQHKLGNAFDFNVRDMSAEAVRQYILKNQDRYPHIRRMEQNVKWVHADSKYTSKDTIVLFRG